MNSCKQVFIPVIAVLNLNSTSPIYRLVVTPNRQLPSLDGSGLRLSYNETIREYHMEMPSLEAISILHNLSILPTCLDFSDGFKSLLNSPRTAITNLTYCLRNKEGYPFLNIEESDGSGYHVMVPAYSGYGFRDIPQVFSMIVSKAVNNY